MTAFAVPEGRGGGLEHVPCGVPSATYPLDMGRMTAFMVQGGLQLMQCGETSGCLSIGYGVE